MTATNKTITIVSLDSQERLLVTNAIVNAGMRVR